MTGPEPPPSRPETDDSAAERQEPVSDSLTIDLATLGRRSPLPVPPPPDTVHEEDRPPTCPTCHKRLVILSSQWLRTESGSSVRRQLWGCPRGHASAYRTNGHFGPVEVLQDIYS